MSASIVSRIIIVSTLATVATGCTAGQIVDVNFNPHPIGDGSLEFVSVDNGQRFTYEFNGDTSANGAMVSFDNEAPDTSANHGGIRNVKVPIPPGRYYVELAGTYSPPAYSSIFNHSYDGSCTDYFTHATDSLCTSYYFQLNFSCPNDKCCYGDEGCVGPDTLPTHAGVKVLPLWVQFPF